MPVNTSFAFQDCNSHFPTGISYFSVAIVPQMWSEIQYDLVKHMQNHKIKSSHLILISWSYWIDNRHIYSKFQMQRKINIKPFPYTWLVLMPCCPEFEVQAPNCPTTYFWGAYARITQFLKFQSQERAVAQREIFPLAKVKLLSFHLLP